MGSVHCCYTEQNWNKMENLSHWGVGFIGNLVGMVKAAFCSFFLSVFWSIFFNLTFLRCIFEREFLSEFKGVFSFVFT